MPAMDPLVVYDAKDEEARANEQFEEQEYPEEHEEEDEGEDEEVEEAPKRRMTSKKKCCLCCLVCCPCCVFLLWLVVVLVMWHFSKIIVSPPASWGQPTFDVNGYLYTPANTTTSARWPGCSFGLKDVAAFNKCGPPCFNSSFPMAMASFSAANPYKLVYFPSRPGDAGQPVVNLSAWWLPAADPNAPIIIIQHGLGSSANSIRAQVPAYMLRTLGFAVLLPSLRGQGLSTSNHPGKAGWGEDTHLDVLGAWDWAVSTKVGGNSSRVGLMGNSMGGFAVAIASGLESRILAFWLDSAIFDPYFDLLKGAIPLGPFASLLSAPAWALLERTSGIKLRYRLPANTLPFRTTPAKVAMVMNDQDVLTDISKSSFINFFKQNPAAGKIDQKFWPNSNCNNEPHAVNSIQFPDRYRADLCRFWSGVFGTPCKSP